jgi:hypothetical protein
MKLTKTHSVMGIIKYTILVVFLIVSMFIPIKVADVLIGRDLIIKKLASANPFPRSLILRDMDPNYDQEWMPSDAYMKNTENLEQKPYRIRTDDKGFIVGPDYFARPNGARKVDIIFFGGSTTECGFVDEEFRFPYLVSKKIKYQSGESFETLNGGVSGNHSLHSLLSIIGKGLPEKPSFIVLMHAINDLVLLSKTKSYWNSPKSRAILQTHQVSSLNDDVATRNQYVANNFATKSFRKVFPHIWVKAIQFAYLRESSGDSAADEWAPFRGEITSPEKLNEILRFEFSSSIRSFVAIAKSWGIEPILMTQFNRVKIDDELAQRQYLGEMQPILYKDFVAAYKLANDIIRDIARDENVFLIDLDRELSGSQKYMYDSVHLNATGSKFVADIISKSLSRKFGFIYESPKN